MCGITGFVETRAGRSPEELARVVDRMTDVLVHRGPDDRGTWVDATCGVALGHRRLSIVDLTSDGRQPMESTDGRFVLAFNGELYNFPALGRELASCGHRFRGRSDTEVLLAAIVEWGAVEALRRANGMFAIALWDRASRRLTLARDRFGEKPLTYGRFGDSFVFASELWALLEHPEVPLDVDREAACLYLGQLAVPAPHSIVRGASKVRPGHYVVVDASGRVLEDAPYYDVLAEVHDAIARPFEGSREDAVSALDAAISEAVRLRMMADVPLGAFLSGGIDSSTVVAMMQRHASRPVRTFSVSVDDARFDEGPFARAVAKHLGTDHTEIPVSSREVLDVVPTLASIVDEPFADSSLLPTLLLSRATRRHVTVALSGDAGDELFGGYARYTTVARRWETLARIPQGARWLGARAVASVPEGPLAWADRIVASHGRSDARMPSRLRARAVGLLEATTLEAQYAHFTSQFDRPERLVSARSPNGSSASERALRHGDPRARLMFHDLVHHLPDDLLTKVDRASMATALEARVPLLDPAVVSLAWRLPMELKIGPGENDGKRILRDVLARYVPRPLFEREKRGFSIPIGTWIAGPLRPWAEDLLASDRLKREGLVRPADARAVLETSFRAPSPGRHDAWTLLLLEAWHLEARGRVARRAGWNRP